MRKSKKFAVRTVKKSQKLVIIQAKTNKIYESLLCQFNSPESKMFQKRVGIEFLIVNQNNVNVIVK